MLMTILLTLLVLSVLLLIATLFRDKRKKMAARGHHSHSSRLSTQRNYSRQSATIRQKEPTLETIKRPPQPADDDTTDDPEQKHLPDEQKPLSSLREQDYEDADAVLGLKPARRVMKARPSASGISSSQSPVTMASTTSTSPTTSVAVTAQSTHTRTPKQHIIIYLKADRHNPYGGYELLQALLANHFRFGQMNIFHRHERTTGEGKVLFSLAAATPSGTFDLSKMGGFSCAGLSLFLMVNQQSNLLVAFDLMLETAHQLIEDLGGSILDDGQQPLTAEKIQIWREEMQAFMQSSDYYA